VGQRRRQRGDGGPARGIFCAAAARPHRRLFGDFARTQAPPDTIFLHELSPVDAALNAAFVGTDSWKMIEILRSRFRDLSGAEGGFAVGAASVTPQSATGAVSPQQATDYQLLEGL